MLDILDRICELQPAYSPQNTPEMQERGRLLRGDLVQEFRDLEPDLSAALRIYGNDFGVDASDGIGRKTELPWVRFYSQRMSPRPTEGFYCVLHFATDGSAYFVTVGCGSSSFLNGSFQTLPESDLARKTEWARLTVEREFGTVEPFGDAPEFGARRPLPISFQRATALAKRFPAKYGNEQEVRDAIFQAARYLATIYDAESLGKGLQPADIDELALQQSLRPLAKTGGQGARLDAEGRRLVELQAMELAKGWLTDHGYRVTDHSANHPYDLHAEKDGTSLKVEVKGTTSEFASAILMTRNEVELHRQDKGNTGLVVVSQISLSGTGASRTAQGGQLEIFLPWDIDEWTAAPTAYRLERKTNG